MRIPLEWLSEYVDLKGLTVAEVSEALNLSGTENEVLSELGDFPSIVVGEILEIAKHPNADRLNITKTRVGEDILQIVCGAPNIEVGQKVPVALVGAHMGEFEIKKTNIRGEESSGMLCSEQELGISEDHEGIMILDPATKVGMPFAEALKSGGPVIDAELTPNRPDCFSIIGIAREVAASTGRKLKSLNFESAKESSKLKINIDVKEKELCPRYIAKIVEGVKIAESPTWLKKKLEQSGVRPINNVVDVTNYVMLEWGQPLHAFDASKISGKIIVRMAKKDEELVTLDGVKRSLTANDLVIADEKGAIAIAGVMGGLSSEVSSETKDIILEAAVFNGTSVRKTAQRLFLRTEASSRFEKGIPLNLPEIAIERAAQLIVETGGGIPAPLVDVLSSWIWVQRVGLRISRLREFLGEDIKTERVLEILKSLGLEAEEFDFKKEARRHVGKPYVFGARFKTHGDLAFDCSYLTDYIYSRIGKFIGYTSLAQFELGEPVSEEELQPGDILFVNGIIDKSVTDHYFVPSKDGGYKRCEPVLGQKVGHNAIYIGGGRIIHARHFEYDLKSKKWIKGKKAEVVEESAEVFTKNPEYIGARRFVAKPSDYIAITVPWWRLDLKIEEDIFEEVVRIFGYDNLGSCLPGGRMPRPEVNPEFESSSFVRKTLSGSGLSEVINYSFLSGEIIGKISNIKNLRRVINPISKEQEYMRDALMPSLLLTALKNQANYESYSIFEIGKVYLGQSEDTRLGLLSRVSGRDKSQAFFVLKGALELLINNLNIQGFEFKESAEEHYELGQAADLFIEGKNMGTIGMISEKLMHDFGIKSPVAYGEIELKQLMEAKNPSAYKTISRYPLSRRDINILVDSSLQSAKIISSIQKFETLKGLDIIDIYTGKELPEDKKSVTIGVTFGSSERTLSDKEISEGTARVIRDLKAIGATLRE
jgi:phenylalanyl-tRNA synthetase beta subunit